VPEQGAAIPDESNNIIHEKRILYKMNNTNEQNKECSQKESGNI
jgi:hypothetical protein